VVLLARANLDPAAGWSKLNGVELQVQNDFLQLVAVHHHGSDIVRDV
jgi:hypothetical protein